jgi:hypothetical protein
MAEEIAIEINTVAARLQQSYLAITETVLLVSAKPDLSEPMKCENLKLQN